MGETSRVGARGWAALFAGAALFLLVFSASAASYEVPTDRVIVRLKGGAPAKSVDASRREQLAVRLSARSGELVRTQRVMGDGAQVMRLFRRLPASQIQ